MAGAAATDPSGVPLPEDLSALSMVEIRSLRAQAQAFENQLSYLRRLVQGHLDIVLHERACRRGQAERGVDVVAQLSDVLADRIHAPGTGHLPLTMEPGEIDPELQAQLDAIAPAGKLSDPEHLTDEELETAVDGLTTLEQDVSGRRRGMFARIDALQAELIRRYRSGEASVDTLLTGGTGAGE